MRRIYLLLAFVFLPWIALSQCNPFYEYNENTTWEMHNYKANDKYDGKQVNKIGEYRKTSDGWVAVVSSEVYDKKNERITEMSFEMKCENGKIKIDLSKYMPEESMQAFKDMDMEFSGEQLILPSNLSVGQELDDATMKITGSIPFKMEMSIEDRKVEGKETITVPAGTFETYKLSYNAKVKAMIKSESMGVEYVAEDIGPVRSESYNKKGKLTYYTVLASHSNL